MFEGNIQSREVEVKFKDIGTFCTLDIEWEGGNVSIFASPNSETNIDPKQLAGYLEDAAIELRRWAPS